MIVDLIKNYAAYPFGEAWEKTFRFLLEANSHTEQKDHHLIENKLIAKVFEYNTKTKAEAVLESHKIYADIHVVFKGKERIEWSPVSAFAPEKEYDEEKDFMLWSKSTSPGAAITLKPGMFALFCPEDAHMPSLNPGPVSENVNKCVIKLSMDLLRK